MSSTLWTRSTWALLLTPLFGCVLNENGSTFGGTNIGRTIKFEGYSDEPQEVLQLQILDPANQNPDSPGAVWSTFAFAISAIAPTTIDTESMYYWTVTAPPVANNGQQARWQPGGLARVRVLKEDGTAIMTFDNNGCWQYEQGQGKTFSEIATICQSHDAPILTFVDRDPLPPLVPQGTEYLGKKATTFPDSEKYYEKIAAPKTFEEWLTFAGFPDPDEVEARYFNAGDLGIGREMHCREEVGPEVRVACYVSNYGFTNDGNNDAAQALAAAIAGDHPFATVAMVYTPNGTQKVRFYTYNDQGALVSQASLDSEGTKNMPGLCIACHGGTHSNGVVTGATFLPFDLNSFVYANSGNFTRANQEEEFRKLNEIVLLTQPGSSTESLVKGWYGGDVPLHTPGTTQNSNWVPPGYAGEEVVYLKAIAPYCRTCHVASSVKFDTFQQLQAQNAVLPDVCSTHIMPNAELTRKAFWNSSARAHLAGALNWATHCK